jgi:hypothetical protein
MLESKIIAAQGWRIGRRLRCQRRDRGASAATLKLGIGSARRASSQRAGCALAAPAGQQQGAQPKRLRRERERGFWAGEAKRAATRAAQRERERHTHTRTEPLHCAVGFFDTRLLSGAALAIRTALALSRSSLGQRGEQQQQQLRSLMQSHARLAIASFSPHSNVAHLQHSYYHHTSISLPSSLAAAWLAPSLLQPSSAITTPSGLAIPVYQPNPLERSPQELQSIRYRNRNRTALRHSLSAERIASSLSLAPALQHKFPPWLRNPTTTTCSRWC